jgi:EmrB/QacA subfamily drug resistance transporter
VPKLTDANRRWWVLVTMTGALSMILIDQTVVSVALPTIQRDLDMSQSGLQWVVNAYLLAIAALVAVGGRVGDMVGTDRMIKLGGLVFVIFSALCGFAQSETWLLASRALQGVGAAAMIPASQSIVSNAFPASERGRAIGIYAGISMVFLALGPMVGGLLTEGVTWRAVFWVNVPVGVAMLALSRISLLPAPREPDASMDWHGIATLVPGLSALVLALMQAQEWGWGSPATIALLAAGAALLAVCVAVELRRRDPLLQLRLLRSRNFSADGAILFCAQFGLIGLTVFGAVWVQNVLGFSPITAGLSLLPLTLPLVVMAPIAGRLYDRIGGRALVTGGCLLMGGAMIWGGAILDHVAYAWLVPGYVLLGVGIGMVMGPSNTDAMNSVSARERGEASGVIQTARQVGGAVGMAIMGTVVASVQQHHIDAFVANTSGRGSADPALVERVLSESHSTQAAAEQASTGAIDAARDALTAAVGDAYYVAGGVMLLAAVVAFSFIRRVRASDA